LAVDVTVAVVSAADVAAGSDSNVPIPKQTVKQSTANSRQPELCPKSSAARLAL